MTTKQTVFWTCLVAPLALAVFTIATVRADYTSQAALAVDPAFQARVKIAAFTAAIAITNEASTVTNHTKRMAFVAVFVSAADTYAGKLAFGVAADPTITAGSSDAVLQTRVNAIWDTYAGKD